MTTPRSVLLVDDHPLFARGLIGYLHQLDKGVSTTVVKTVSEATRELTKGPLAFDAAVIDYDLPDHDGLELIGWAHRKHPRIKTVLYAASVTENVARDALRLGASAVLHKQDDIDEVFAQMFRAFGWQLPPRLEEGAPAAVPIQRLDDAAALVAGPLPFSPREARVLALVMSGKSNKMIAREAKLTEATVKADVTKLLRWCENEQGVTMSSRSALGAHAVGRGFTIESLLRFSAENSNP